MYKKHSVEMPLWMWKLVDKCIGETVSAIALSDSDEPIRGKECLHRYDGLNRARSRILDTISSSIMAEKD